MKFILTTIFVLLSFIGLSQTFTYSGYIYTASGAAAVNVPVKIYKRTTPSLTGHLVTVTTSAENTFIFNLWPSGWIGLTDEVTEGVWRWVTGEAYSYTSWNPGEPNNAGNEDYVQFVGGGKWNDLPNSVSLPYVLEFEYIVNYTSWALVTTVYTNTSGYYIYSGATNPSVEWYAEISAPNPVTIPTNTDITAISNVVNKRTTFNGIHYYMYDVNNDGKITISDAYYVNARRWNIFASWIDIFNSLLFTVAQYNAIKATTLNVKTTYPGVSSIVTPTMTSSTSTNYYLISPGYSGTVNY